MKNNASLMHGWQRIRRIDMYDRFYPGQVWLDTNGRPIQAVSYTHLTLPTKA